MLFRSRGDSARRNFDRMVTWEEAANRIRDMYEDGNYVDNLISNNAIEQEDVYKRQYENHPVKGKLTIYKKGEMLTGFKKDFVYEERYLKLSLIHICIEEQLNKEGETADSVTKTATEGTKEFYTISTKSGKIFYLIIDNSKSQDNVYFLTEVSEKDLMNFTLSDSVTLPEVDTVYAEPCLLYTSRCV